MVILGHRIRPWPTCLLASYLISIVLVLYAGAYLKVPVRDGSYFWKLRLDGEPNGFLGEDENWVYYAVAGHHGWHPMKVSITDVQRKRSVAFRQHVGEVLTYELYEEDIRHLCELTGLALNTDEAWRGWWKANRETYGWPERAEAKWEAAVLEELPEYSQWLRDHYKSQIASVRIKAFLEIAFFALFFTLLWSLPLVFPKVRRRFAERRPYLANIVFSLVALAVFYFVAVSPHALFGYAPGACSTYDGPGALSSSGPYPFGFGYKPGNTIIYRQFLEPVFTPAILLGDLGLLSWLPPVPLFIACFLPYPFLAAAVGALIGKRVARRIRKAGAGSVGTQRC